MRWGVYWGVIEMSLVLSASSLPSASCFLATLSDPLVPEHALPIHKSPLCMLTPLLDMSFLFCLANCYSSFNTQAKGETILDPTRKLAVAFTFPYRGYSYFLCNTPYSYTKICVSTFPMKW